MKNSLTSILAVAPRLSAPPSAVLPLPLSMALVGCAPGALGVLGKLTVAVVGCGSVGGRIALLLTRMGIGGLLLVDPKRYKPGSLATHDVSPEDVGQPKALVVARRCKDLNPALRVQAYVGPVEALELAGLADVDLVVMAPDLISAELELGQRCLWLSKALVQGSVHGPTLTVQIRFFGTTRDAGGCPACAYGQAELDLMARQVRFSCEGAPSAGAVAPDSAPATNSISALCSLAADLAVVQILRFFLELGQSVTNTMLEYCGYTHRTVATPIKRNPQCRLQHTAFTQATVDSPLAGLTLAQLAQRATGASVGAAAQFDVADFEWVEFAACGCAQPTPVRRFVPRGRTRLAQCHKCSAPLVPLSFYTHRVVSASVLGSALDRPLNKLGARRVSSVVLRTGDNGVLLREQSPTPAAS
jgi:molybdopterin/thiamine biosynthesis adenylyltransferase